MKETQRSRIVRYLKDFGSITSWEAYEALGVTQLGARIFELKEKGYEFKKEWVTKKNRYGMDVKFSKYQMTKEGDLYV